MNKIFAHVADLIIYRPDFVMLGIILVIIVSIFGMTMLFMATGNDTYIDRNSERGRVLNDYTETFQE